VSDQTHHSAAAQSMLVPAVPEHIAHTEDHAPTRPTSQDPDDTAYQRAVEAERAAWLGISGP
jgi:hypothetical protein